MEASKQYTPAMLRKFDRLTWNTGSPNQLTRIKARLDLDNFIAEHGKDVCDQMFEVIKNKKARKK